MDKDDNRKLWEGSVCGYGVVPLRMNCMWPTIPVKNIMCSKLSESLKNMV